MKYTLLLSALLFFASCQSQTNKDRDGIPKKLDLDGLAVATFAGGCFWCVEASFEQIKGVEEAISGYSGGTKANATYQKVSYGLTKHAEAVQVYYDPEVISYKTLLDIFFTAHDPTQVNRQGPDVGTQYRSAIFYHDVEQKQAAEAAIKEWQAKFPKPIATELTELDAFYEAEDYHQDYEKHHPNQSYIVNVSRPKINKVRKAFADLLKD